MKKNYLKRFAAWATGLKGNIFLYARLRLSALYLLAMLLVVGVYSTALFFSIRANIIEDFEDRFEQVDVRSKALVRTLDILEEKIILADTAVLGLMGLLSYLLAGMTLKPIAVALGEQRKFSSDASHELRTPLTVMKTELEVALKSRELSAAQARGIFASSLEEINRMSALIEDLLLISRGQAKKAVLEKLDLAAVAGAVVEKMRALAEEKNIALFFSPGKGLVRGERRFLERMAINITQNAISYTPAGGKVAVEVKTGNGIVLFAVRDTGVGIAPEHLSHVFDRFYKAAGFHESGGTGLGLSIVKEIVRLHNGDILLNSLPGKGTEVIVTLPEFRP
ncbi:MAG: ATP-binding protein [Elusimicrobia bacterium]|nr:ATP-binding protein [Elusimicrobiota bacterium]